MSSGISLRLFHYKFINIFLFCCQVTDGEIDENSRFLDAIMETELMQETQAFLVGKGRATEDTDEFKSLLYKLWFRLYRRSRGQRFV